MRLPIIKLSIVVAILLLSILLKMHNYAQYPQRGASSDEYTYTFLGISLLKTGVPMSWSYFSAYKHKYDLTINKLYFPMVYPYFDHTPLNGFLVGGWSILAGQDDFEEVELKTIRLVPIFLSIISSILVFLLGVRLYSYKTATWALLIYTTTTIFVMNTRVVFAENLLTPLFLTALYCFSLWKQHMNYQKAFILALLCGLSFWTKEVGIVVFCSLLYLFISEKIRVKYILLLSFLSIFSVVLYILYGTSYDKEVFWQIISSQSNRDIGSPTLLMLMSSPIIVNKVYFDGWYFLGLISMFISFLDYHKHKILLIPAAAYFLLLIFSLTREGEMGWYMIPLFPFMSLFTASLLVENMKKVNGFIFLLLLFIGLSQIKFLYEDVFGLTTIQFRILLLLLFGPSIILLTFRKEKAFNVLGQVWFYLFILGNIILTYNYIHPA